MSTAAKIWLTVGAIALVLYLWLKKASACAAPATTSTTTKKTGTSTTAAKQCGLTCTVAKLGSSLTNTLSSLLGKNTGAGSSSGGGAPIKSGGCTASGSRACAGCSVNCCGNTCCANSCAPPQCQPQCIVSAVCCLLGPVTTVGCAADCVSGCFPSAGCTFCSAGCLQCCGNWA